MKRFGVLVHEARKKKNMTVHDLLRQFNNIISPAYITKIERHGEIPSPLIVCKLATLLEIPQKVLISCAVNEKINVYRKVQWKRYSDMAGKFKPDFVQ